MQKIILQRAGKHAALAATAVLYFAALTMFSYVFTQS
jgi:hypothetical protein